MTPKAIPFSQLKYHWPIYFFAFPSLLVIGLFVYYPALSGVLHSFYRWNGADINEYIGLDNYIALLSSADFWRSFRVSLILGAFNVLKMIPAVAVAICIHRCKSTRLQFLYRIAFVAPMVIPALITVLIWRSFFFEATSGYLNTFLNATGLSNFMVWAGIIPAGTDPAWLGDGRLLLYSCIIWGFPWVGSFAVLTHLAKLQNVPRELYEAAHLDGCNWWTTFTKLELPLMMGSINILLVFVIIDTIKDAGLILALVGIEGGPGGVVTVPALFMLRKAFVDQQMGAACAAGIVLTIVVMALKKILDGTSDWQSLGKKQKARYRLLFMSLGVALYAFMLYSSPDYARFGSLAPGRKIAYFLTNAILPAAILAGAMPWGTLLGMLRRSRPDAAIADPWRTTPEQARVHARHQQRIATSGYQLRQRLKGRALTFSRHGFVLCVLACAYLPMYLMLVVSVKDNTQFYHAPATVTEPAHWQNWGAAWAAVGPALANSVLVTASSTMLTLVLALGAAYFFARVKVPGSQILWNAILILMMMPTIANLVPLFRLLIDMNLSNTLSALIAVGAAGGQVFAIFVLRGFVADIPQDLFEAAEIDGASQLRQMSTIVAPLAGPILGVVGVMHAVQQWNDFVLPLVIIRDGIKLPVMVQLHRMAGEYIKLWGPLMAGYAVASIPVIVLFILCMRLFTRGLTEGAVKG